MANVCVGCGLDVDNDGKLIVQIKPSTAAQPNSLECTATGLSARSKRKHLRRTFTAVGSLAVASAVGPSVQRAMSGYGTVEDNGSAAGLWTIQGDGSILINVEGVYMVSQQTILEGSTGQVVGGRARVTEGGATADIICSAEINDKNKVIDLAYVNDGPEFSASGVRHFQVNDVINYISTAYLATVGQGINWAGDFTITYLGEFL